jgi:hypothetical protein
MTIASRSAGQWWPTPIDAASLDPRLPGWLRDMHGTGRGSSARHARHFAADLAAMPGRWQQTVIGRTVGAILDATDDAGEIAAWREYEALLSRVRKAPVRLDADDDDIRAKAQRCARHCADLSDKHARIVDLGAWPLEVSDFMRTLGVDPPSGRRVSAMVARAICALWWRRVLRRQVARSVERNAIALGFVHKRADVYVSQESYRRRKMQNASNAAMLEATKATNEWAQEYTLAELASVSVSSRDIRRNELIIRLKGFEEFAARRSHDALFVTLTCPSRFHARLHTGEENRNHVPELDPREAQGYLRTVWARIRAKLHRSGIAPYGFRIAEPHGDGTPHWHFVLFVDPAAGGREVAPGFVGPPVPARVAIERAFRAYGLADSPDEPGAQEHRLAFVPIDRERGTATGYAIKYISKNIDGFRVGEWKIDDDLAGDATLNLAPRVEAWAATWGIRQFQQIGGPAVGIWREFRRVGRIEEGKAGLLSPEFVSCFFAAQRHVCLRVASEHGELIWKKQADFAAFMEALKIEGKRWREPMVAIQRDLAVRCNRYGEVMRPEIIGLRDRFHWRRDFGGIVGDQVTRTYAGTVESLRHDWKVQRSPKGKSCMPTVSPS